VIILGSEALENALRDFGATEKEAEVYIFLAKRGAQKTSYISKQLKKNKGIVHRSLKNLQKKGLVEATLEHPTRFIAVQFEKLIDSFIKSKQEEVTRIEETKKDLLSDWKKISKSELESPLEKFVVIEGDKKIFQKMSQMIKETNIQLSVTSAVSDLVRAEQFGVFDSIYHNPLRSKGQFHILTEGSNQNLKAIKLLRARMKGFDFRGRNPDLGLSIFPRMVIRDNEEIILFISNKNEVSSSQETEVCFFTNCKSIIQAFSGVFEDLWKDSVDIKHLIDEIETGKLPQKTQIIKDPISAEKKYYKVLNSAKQEILIVTSSKGLMRLLNNNLQLKEWFEKGVIIRVMSPITGENLNIAQQLMDYCEVRHIPVGYLETTIVDSNHLFQFRYSLEDRNLAKTQFFVNTF